MASNHIQVQCPFCGSFDTRPVHGGRLGKVKDALWQSSNLALAGFGFIAGRHTWRRLIIQHGFGFENPKWVRRFNILQVQATCDACAAQFLKDTPISASLQAMRQLERRQASQVTNDI